jgi:hypothetical protein
VTQQFYKQNYKKKKQKKKKKKLKKKKNKKKKTNKLKFSIQNLKENFMVQFWQWLTWDKLIIAQTFLINL